MESGAAAKPEVDRANFGQQDLTRADALAKLLVLVAVELQLSIEEYHHSIPFDVPTLLVKAASASKRDLAEIVKLIEERLRTKPEPARLRRSRVLTMVKKP